MHSGAIVIKKADQLVPEELFKKVLTENKSCYGAATIAEGMIGSGAVPKTGTIEELMKSQLENKDIPVVFFFGNFPAGFAKEDMQPYVLLRNAEQEPIVVAFLEGNFPGFEKTDSAHAAEYYVVIDELIPKFQSYFEMVGEDLDKLTKQFEGVMIKKDMDRLIGERGVITLLAANGKISTFEDNSEGNDFSWGWASKTYGYNGAPVAVKEKEVVSETGLGSFRPGNKKVVARQGDAPAVKPVEVPKPVVETKPDAPKAPVEAPKTDTAIPAGVAITVKCPDNVHAKNAIKDYYRTRLGFVPENWKQKPSITDVPRGKAAAIKSFADPALANAMPAAAPKADAGQPMGPVEKARTSGHVVGSKDTGVKHIAEITPSKSGKDAKKEPQEAVALLSADTKKYLADSWLKGAQVVKSLDANSKEIPDPAKLQEIETKFGSFCDQNGMNLEDFFRTDLKAWIELGEHCPDALALALCDFRRAYIKMLKEEDRPSATKPVVEGNAPKRIARQA